MDRNARRSRPLQPRRAPARGNGFVNAHGYPLLKTISEIAMSRTMTSKITSRFRRRTETEATAPEGLEAPVVQTVEAKAESATPETAPGRTEAKATDTKSEAKPDLAAEPKAVMGPARLVEMERPKPAPQPDLRPAKAWLSNAHAYRVPAAAAAALVAALLTGYGLGVAGQVSETGKTSAKSAALLASSAKDLRDAQGQIVQLATELKSIKGAVENMKGDREKSRGDILAKQAQLSERVERAGQENASRIGRLAEQVDRIEKSTRQASAEKAADKADKSDKPERVAAAPIPPARPVRDVAHTGSLPDPKAADQKGDPRKTPLDGYVVRDYDDGYALIETRAGRYIDVAVGYTLPGVGKVEAIERRGRQWVVVTPKGYIGER